MCGRRLCSLKDSVRRQVSSFRAPVPPTADVLLHFGRLAMEHWCQGKGAWGEGDFRVWEGLVEGVGCFRLWVGGDFVVGRIVGLDRVAWGVGG